MKTHLEHFKRKQSLHKVYVWNLFYDLSDSQKIAFAAPYFGRGGGLKGFSGKTFSLFSVKIFLNGLWRPALEHQLNELRRHGGINSDEP